MNAFRITLLVLLALVIALMFYAIQVVVPGWQGQYNEYTATQRVNELEQKTEAHLARISRLDPKVDSPEVATARSVDAEVVSSNEKALNEAEEQSVIAAARREEEAKQAPAPARTSTANTPPVLGEVTAYDAEWGVLLFRPGTGSSYTIGNGAVVAVTHDGQIICEATVDGSDAESGQYTATVKAMSSNKVQLNPQAGDKIIQSPFLSADDLRRESGMFPRTVEPTPIPAAAQSTEDLPSLPLDSTAPLPEVDATLTPVP